MRTLALFFSLLSIAAADPPLVATVSPNPVRMPATTQAAAVPVPQKLTASVQFIIDSDVGLIVTGSRDGVVKVVEEAGPLRVRGYFIDAPTKLVTKTFKGKFLYSVEPAKTGTVELLIIPVGVKTSKEIIRRTLEVDAGEGPMPPPDPKPDPKPTPTGTKAWVVVVEETSMRTPEQIRVLADLKYWQSLSTDGKHLGWRFYDKDSPDVTAKKYLKGDALPVLLLIDKDGNEVYRGPLPSSTAEIDRIYTEKTGVSK